MKLTPGRLTIFTILTIIALFLFCHVVEAKTVYFTYDGNATKELYTGGYLHFPKSIADKIKVCGGIVEKENDKEWAIKVTKNTVVVEYIKLTNNSFSYGKKTYSAKEFPAELYEPVMPEEMRLTLMSVNQNYANLTKELNNLKAVVNSIKDRPTFGEEVKGFLLYFPPVWVAYIIFGILGFLTLLGWWYERD
ncbi:hypothetical protein DRO97_01985 [Archaeoglobales archaeon]|nr:MAG: hypothetical protein DRO97_01985 [Archaeoglobales archaeon]